MAYQSINETRLDNGLTIVSDQMPGVRSVTLGFFFRKGSRHEPEALNGISHFIEHTIFKGTDRRSAIELAFEQERLGGNMDAFTTHEEVGFAMKVIDDAMPDAFALLDELTGRPRFAPSDLDSERQVIIEEMKMVEDSPDEHLGDLFNEAYFAGHPLGLPITGTAETVGTFSHDVTAAYHREHFAARNLVIAAAGNVDHDDLVALARASALGSGNGVAARPVSSPPVPQAPIIVRRNENLEQVHLIIATPLVAATDDRRYAADLLAGIIGGGTASRLWQKIREERGLAYHVGSSALMYTDCGLFTIYAGTSPENAPELVELAIDEMRRVRDEGVTASELDLAKQQATASILLSLEDSASRAAAVAQSEIVYGRQIKVEETLERIAAVGVDDLLAIADEYFVTDMIAFAALGDIDENQFGRAHLTL